MSSGYLMYNNFSSDYIRKYAGLNIGDNYIIFYIDLAIFALFSTYYLYKLPKTFLELYKEG